MKTRARTTFVQVAALAASVTMLGGCAAKQEPYAAAYRQALSSQDSSAPASEEAIQNFLAVYAGMTRPDLAELVDVAYAPSLYFNDTLKTIHDREALKHYLASTARHLDDLQVEVLSIHQDNGDVYVRWIMHTAFEVAGRDIQAESIGITHLRFNPSGQVILHQDFWDNTEGLFSHLPFVGGVVRWARSKT